MVDPEYLRSLIRERPFRRFTVVMNDGTRYEVKRLASVMMTPDGATIRFADVDPLKPVPTCEVKEVVVEPALSQDAVQRIETIRQLRNAAPFVPFSVEIDDGRRLLVDRSYRIAIAPSGREICYASSPIDFQFIPSGRVREVLRDAR
jgi:hypothetical protein